MTAIHRTGDEDLCVVGAHEKISRIFKAVERHPEVFAKFYATRPASTLYRRNAACDTAANFRHDGALPARRNGSSLPAAKGRSPGTHACRSSRHDLSTADEGGKS